MDGDDQEGIEEASTVVISCVQAIALSVPNDNGDAFAWTKVRDLEGGGEMYRVSGDLLFHVCERCGRMWGSHPAPSEHAPEECDLNVVRSVTES
jgi:hypothetical protein